MLVIDLNKYIFPMILLLIGCTYAENLSIIFPLNVTYNNSWMNGTSNFPYNATISGNQSSYVCQYWKDFNDTNGLVLNVMPIYSNSQTNITDSSGLGNHGNYIGETFNNGTYSGTFGNGAITGSPAWIPGKYGYALNFSGGTQTVTVTPSFALNVSGSPGITMMAWAYRSGSQVNNYEYILRKKGSDPAQNTVYGISNGYVSDTLKGFIRTNASVNCQSFDITNSSTTPANNTWFHIALTYNASDGRAKAYVNGVQTYSNGIAAAGSVINNSAGNFVISDKMDGTMYWNGSIDAVRVWNRTLDVNEIIAEMNSPIPASGDELVSSFELDEGTGTTTYENKQHVMGKYGLATNLDGYSSYHAVPYTSALTPTYITWSMWLYVRNWSNVALLRDIRAMSKTELGGWNFGLNIAACGENYVGSQININSSYSQVCSLVNNLTPGWHFFTVSFDGQYIKQYVDANLLNTIDAGAGKIITYTNNNAIIIGAEAGGGAVPAGTNYYKGMIDAVRIWNRSLNATEIAIEMNSSYPANEYGLLGNWEFEETYGNISRDTHNYVTGIEGSALRFDGVNDYVSIPNSSSINPKSISISLWEFMPSTPPASTYPGMVDKSKITSYAILALAQTSNFRFYINTSNVSTIEVGSDVGINAWHHLVFTYDNSTGNMSIYVDGILRNSSIHAYGGSISSDNNPILIGKRSDTPQYFSGSMDDIRIYNRSLNETEINTMYNATVGQYIANNNTIQQKNITPIVNGSYNAYSFCYSNSSYIQNYWRNKTSFTIRTVAPSIANGTISDIAIMSNQTTDVCFNITDEFPLSNVSIYMETPNGNYNFTAHNTNGSNWCITCNGTSLCTTNVTGIYYETSAWVNNTLGYVNSSTFRMAFSVERLIDEDDTFGLMWVVIAFVVGAGFKAVNDKKSE